jgi:TfoX/Sxy family transcriptional regulator of competence genes
MAWQKIPKEHHALFTAAFPADDRATSLAMFGGLAGTVNGHMFAGLWADTACVRLPEDSRAEALALKGSSIFDPMGNGRTMKDMVVLPPKVFQDAAALRGWMRRAFDYTATLPPKKAKAAKKKAPGKKTPGKKKP